MGLDAGEWLLQSGCLTGKSQPMAAVIIVTIGFDDINSGLWDFQIYHTSQPLIAM
jgi:hypothetical protein